uniref:Uncharacterized protein n=1 Tax=Panagrolaimus sp. PS1159 TaxID=55785 RepID=A0AC35GL59_9BILA
MVRIYCLTSIITEELFIANKISGIDYGNDAEIFPDDNTKAALEKIKNDANIFKSYKLTELSIGYHLFGNEKVYYLLIFRKDSGLFVFKMIPGSVKFEAISNTVIHLSVATSTLFPYNNDFNLVIRIQCIKNTSVRGITEKETEYYEKVESDIKNICGDNQDLQESIIEKLNFDLPLQSGQKVLRQKITDIRTAIELLCDERNGSVGNIVENARYNQKAHCDRLIENSKKEGRRSSRKRSFSSAALSDSFDDSIYDNTFMESDDISENNRRGRPALYISSEERRQARIYASKKYTEKKKAKFEEFKKEVKLLEMENQNMIKKFKGLFVEFGHKMPEDKRTVIEDILIQKNNFETSINDRLKTMTFSSPPKDCSRKEKQKILVRRVRERQKTDKIIAEEKYNFLCKQNSELRKQIEEIDKLRHWMEDMVAINNPKVETSEIERSKADELEKEHRFNVINFEPINFQESVTNIPKLNEHQTIVQTLPNNPSPAQLINIQEMDNRTIEDSYLSILFPKHANLIYAPTTNFASLKDLILQRVNLKEVCECIFEKLPPSMEFINMSHNNISFISKSISRMKNLKFLNLSNNNLDYFPWESLPSSIEYLNLSNSNLEKISILNLQNLAILELQNSKLSALPPGFEMLSKLKYLDLCQNLFTKNLNLKELLWNRLPSNISILNISQNDLGQIPCQLKNMKLKHISANNCKLTNICSYFLNQSRKSEMILEISGNWELEKLPLIPEKIFQPNLTKADASQNFSFNGLSLITDNESFINTSRFPTKNDKPFYEFFEECKNIMECKCCAICGNLKEKTIKQLMVMDFNLCLAENFESLELNLFENGKNIEIKNIMQQFKNRIKEKMHLIYGPGNWKTEIVTGLCLKCFLYLKIKIDESALNINSNKMEGKQKNSIKAEETSYITEMDCSGS